MRYPLWNALRWMPLDLTDDKSTLVQVMAWCRQATSHYLSQCWPRSMSPNGVTRPQGVKHHGSLEMRVLARLMLIHYPVNTPLPAEEGLVRRLKYIITIYIMICFYKTCSGAVITQSNIYIFIYIMTLHKACTLQRLKQRVNQIDVELNLPWP